MLKTAIAGLAVILTLPFALMAQRHPGYLHALSDLRYARELLEHGNWGPAAADREHAIGEIDRAIEELRRAAVDDGKNPYAHPPIEERWEPRDRLHRAEEALGRAREMISREEDNPDARGWRDRAFHHIEDARHAIHHAIDVWR
jgi:hypothetical protein